MSAAAFTELALSPFTYGYMRNAIFGAGVVGALCAVLSCFVTLRGWALLGDALSHAVVPGVALAYLAGLPFIAGAFAAGLLAVAGIGMVERSTILKGDAAIGIVFSTFLAAGLLLVSLYPSNLRLTTILFGNLLGISETDLLQVYAAGGICLLVLLVFWKDLLLLSFDPGHARSIGLPVRFLNVLLLALLSLAAVSALQAVGAILVVAMLVTPGATAYLLTDSFRRMLVIAPVLGGAATMLGAYASFFLDASVGGCIVVLQTAIFLLVWVFAPKHGLVAGRRRVSEAAAS